MPAGQDHSWATAQQLERLMLNARGALQHADAELSDIEFRTALLTATDHVIVALAPPSDDSVRQAEHFARILAEHLRAARATTSGGREAQHTLTEQLMAAYEGPDVA